MVYVKVLSEHLYRKTCKNRKYLTYDEDFYVLLAVLFVWEKGAINTVLEVITLIMRMERASSSETLPSICQRTWGRIPFGTNPQLSLIQDIRLWGEIRYAAKMTVESALKLNIPSVRCRISVMRKFLYYSPHATHTLTHSNTFIEYIHQVCSNFSGTLGHGIADSMPCFVLSKCNKGSRFNLHIKLPCNRISGERKIDPFDNGLFICLLANVNTESHMH